ncbi:hypothetical protein [Brevibacterium picturae]|uniref:Uncharacterized protein n=1 Tax=Brevibacterium picturae TaxID=260553 RepID=A0ABN2BEN5_9MICO
MSTFVRTLIADIDKEALPRRCLRRNSVFASMFGKEAIADVVTAAANVAGVDVLEDLTTIIEYSTPSFMNPLLTTMR